MAVGREKIAEKQRQEGADAVEDELAAQFHGEQLHADLELQRVGVARICREVFVRTSLSWIGIFLSAMYLLQSRGETRLPGFRVLGDSPPKRLMNFSVASIPVLLSDVIIVPPLRFPLILSLTSRINCRASFFRSEASGIPYVLLTNDSSSTGSGAVTVLYTDGVVRRFLSGGTATVL